MDESSSDEETVVPPVGGAEKDSWKMQRPKPKPNRWCGCPSTQGMSSPCTPGPIDELIAALCEATLGPVHAPDVMDSIHFLMRIE